MRPKMVASLSKYIYWRLHLSFELEYNIKFSSVRKMEYFMAHLLSYLKKQWAFNSMAISTLKATVFIKVQDGF